MHEEILCKIRLKNFNSSSAQDKDSGSLSVSLFCFSWHHGAGYHDAAIANSFAWLVACGHPSPWTKITLLPFPESRTAKAQLPGDMTVGIAAQ